MADEIRHRGPDDDGYFVKENIALASRRLSIIDIQQGKQPISNESNTIHVIFNGEIYNYPELRESLQARGHHFRTHTDTEVIVHLYEEHGTDCLGYLRGMFAIALWDEQTQRLLLARDPLGQKPLYYSADGGNQFIFASEVKALLQHGSISPRLNKTAMHHVISLRYAPGTTTLFEQVEKLPAGHFLTLENGVHKIERYWDLRYTPKLRDSEEEVAARLKSLLMETVECHMLSDAPLGAFLSGGMDSSLIVAFMARASSRPVKTFSVGCRESTYNELPFARMLADRYQTEHYEEVVEASLISALPRAIYFMEEPLDPSAFGIYYASRIAAKHVKVVLGGDGGDEMFAGYDRYLGNQLADLYCLLPSPLRRRLIEPIIRRLPDDFSYNNRVQKLRWLVAMSHINGGKRYAESACFLRFGNAQKRQVYSEPLWNELQADDSVEHLLRFFETDNAHDAVDRMLYTDVKTRLADNILMINDRMTMAHSIEGRSPFVDQKLAEFAATIPANMKIRGRRLRHIQRRVAAELLPEALIGRPKKGFGFPLAHWFRNELRSLTSELLCHGRLVTEGLFRADGIALMLEEHFNGKFDHNYRLWMLLNLELWYRIFVEQQTLEAVEETLHELLHSREAVPV
jgi:asparagine synthase (glutamine-hydrolysing)